jgi:hypothetical protein
MKVGSKGSAMSKRTLGVRGVGRRRPVKVLLIVASMALVAAACTPPPPPAGTDVVILARQQPNGLANYQNLPVANQPPSDPFPSGFFIDVDGAERVAAYVSRPFLTIDSWWIECSAPPTDNGDGSFSCPADLEYGRAAASEILVYEGQGLLSTWPDADPELAAFVGTTTYAYSFGIGGYAFTDPARVGQTWTEQLRFQDGDDTVTWPPIP